MHLRLLRLPAVTERVGLGVTSIYSRAKAGLFPPPVKLTQRASAWPEHEVDAIAVAMIAGKTDEEVRELVRELIAGRSKIMSHVGAHAAPPASRTNANTPA